MSRFHHQSDAALETVYAALTGEPDLLPAEGPIAFLHGRPHEGLAALSERLVCLQDFKPVADSLEAAGWKNAEKLEGKFPVVILLPERQKLQTLADFAQAFELLEDGGLLIAGLHNDWGAKRYEKYLDQVAGKLGTLSKHHSRAFWTRQSERVNRAQLQEWKAQGEWQQVVDGRFWSRPGLFSWNKIDAGSQLLVQHLPETMKGRVADLGGGWGFLSDFVLRERPEVTVLEIFEGDRNGLEAARRNLADIPTRTRVTYNWKDVPQGAGEKQYDFIVMNPPYHEDRQPDALLGIQFLAAAALALKPTGELWLVANRHLPYERYMSEAFAESSIITQDGSYKVMRGVRGLGPVFRAPTEDGKSSDLLRTRGS